MTLLRNKFNEQNKKKKGVEKNKVKSEYVAPDGGWGWFIVLGAGLSNLCILSLIQNFGLLFRNKYKELGITEVEISTILNVNLAVTACIGLANGPLFKIFSFRQIALAGTVISSLSTMVLSTARTFHEILIYMSVFQATGSGIAISANALALNTYFKKRKRLAVGLSWTCTGLGPIIMPQIITALMPIYDVSGTLLILGGIAAHSIAFSLLLQPVSWHAKKLSLMDEIRAEAIKEKGDVIFNNGLRKESKHMSVENFKEKLTNIADDRQGFGSQYLYYDDEEEGAAGIDVMPTGTPMMSRANDGWFSKNNSSTISLASMRTLKNENSHVRKRNHSFSLSRPASIVALSHGQSLKSINRQINDNEGRKLKSSTQINGTTPLIIVKEICETPNIDDEENQDDVSNKLQLGVTAKEETVEVSKRPMDSNNEQEIRFNNSLQAHNSIFKRIINGIVIFFDLDLLRDKIFVNLMLGITFANFTEINFALITPFLLGDYKLAAQQVATYLSVLAGVDVATRILISFIATKIGFSNRTFFLIGISSMAVGRIVLAHTRDFRIILMIAVLIGFGKSLRTIFIALVIPSHVPLSRLPAATGLQLLTSGTISLSIGPIIGCIKGALGIPLLLHILNIFTYLVIISWSIEAWITSRKLKKEDNGGVNSQV